ncbi:MAG TPA: GAF domain-containing sensor histidine kinase [Anaeromyxobacteraceae bacterium]|nr:GAF domain-containing sensor histidine kinase [Anaeromyxobacteraceae bacterium]
MTRGVAVHDPSRASEPVLLAAGQLADPRRAAEHFAALQRVTAAFAAALTVRETAEVLFGEAGALLGASAGNVCILQGEDFHVAASHGLSDDLLEPWQRFSRLTELPASEAARTGRPVYLESPEAFDAAYPALADLRRAHGHAAWATLPLVVYGRTLGVMGLGWREPRAFDAGDRAFLAVVASQCAMAMERARLYEAERAARARAEAAEEEARRIGALQERLMAVVGHDLRTPLQAVVLGTQVLSMRGGLSDSQATTVARVASSAARMNGIIRDLLDFTRARQGSGIAVSRVPMDATATFERAVAELQQLHPARRIAFSAPRELPCSGDPERLLQVASNLVGNALQHGPRDAAISVEVRGSDGEVALRVHNEGPPIPPGMLPAIFQPFRRAREDGAGERPGSIGLGLFIVREIARAHGGDVTCESAEGSGTAFTVTFPRAV